MLPPSRSAARLAISLAAALAGLAAPSAVSAATSPFSPGDPFFGAGLLDAKKEASAQSSDEAKAERERSRHRYESLSAADSLALGRKFFPEAFSMDLFDGKHPAPGLEIVDYNSSNSAVAETTSGEKLLVQSTAPLRAKNALGQTAPVDLGLQDGSDAFVTENAYTDLVVNKDIEDGVNLPGKDVTITPVGVREANGQKSQDRVFFARVETDTDYLVMPHIYGTEVGWLLRTSDAPERFVLDVDMPAGAALRRAVSKNPIRRDPPRGLEIVKDGKVLLHIQEPQTYDANRAPVKTELSIVGDDQIAMTVEHKGKDLAYPLYADPPVYTSANIYAGWAGWGPDGGAWYSHGGNYTYNWNYYGVALNDPGYDPNGIYLSMPTNTFYQPNGTGVNWSYRAPANSYIYRANLGNVSLYPLQGSYSWYNIGYRFAYLYNGFLINNRTAWDSSSNWTASANGSIYGSGNGLMGPNSDARLSWTFNHCYAVPCNSGTGTENNEIDFGLSAINAYNSAQIATGDGRASARMTYAEVYLGDRRAPSLTSARPADRDWHNDGGNLKTLTASASDPGLGVKSITLGGAASGNGTLSHPCTGDPYRADKKCPPSWSTNGFGYRTNEGVNTLTLRANDILDNPSPVQTWTEKVDRSSPAINLSGSLSNDGQALQAGTTYTLNVNASDAGTGVKSIKILFDGDDEASSPDATCGPNGGCPLNYTYNLEANGLSAGEHTITVQATDIYGHQPTEKDITFTAPGTPPSDQDPNVDELTPAPATPDPMTPSGPAAAGTFTRAVWLADETNTGDGVSVVTSTSTATSALTGTAIDGTTAVIPNASVTLAKTGTTLTTTTNVDGAYAFSDVPAGVYTLTITAPGYGSHTVTNSALESGESYYRQAELTATAKTVDEAATNRDSDEFIDRAAASRTYPSVARVPPYIRVAKTTLNQDCSPATPITTATVVRYPMPFYVYYTMMEEVGGVGYNERSYKALAQMVSNFAWYATVKSKYAGTGRDISNSTNDQCFRPDDKKIPSKFLTWMRESTFQNRITFNNRSLEETRYKSGTDNGACIDSRYPKGGGDASQYIIHYQGQGTCTPSQSGGGDFSTWQGIVRYWVKGKLGPASPPPPASVTSSVIPGPDVGVRLNFKSGSERGLAWRYTLQRRLPGAPRWQDIAQPSFGSGVAGSPVSRGSVQSYRCGDVERMIALCIDHRTASTWFYRVRANSPAGTSRYTYFNDGNVIPIG